LYDTTIEQNKINVEVVDNVDAECFDNLLKRINIKKTMFNIVTKSGTTVEIISMFAVVLEKLKNELGEDYFVNIVVTTGKDNVLWNYCQENKIKTYEIVQELARRFEEVHTTLSCEKILELAQIDIQIGGSPEARTDEYYRKRPCGKIVYQAAEILEKYLIEKKIIKQ
jgi:glucose-6-phosphate isomerase